MSTSNTTKPKLHHDTRCRKCSGTGRQGVDIGNARPENRVFRGVFPTGFVYADRNREKHGDYARLAYISFATLALEVERDCPAHLAEYIRQDAAKVQARKGEQYQTSGSGQTITLGYALVS